MIGGIGVKYVPGSAIELSLPSAGEYRLTYITTTGTFTHEFQTIRNNETEEIPLQPGVEVIEAYILPL